MSDFLTLAAAIAAQLDGTIRRSGDEADDAPTSLDMAWIDLANEREGLRVVIMRGHGADSSRLRATMSQTMASRDGATFSDLPDFYKLETAAAMGRGARAIAAQIETKLVQPSIPMLEAWQVKRAERRAMMARLEAAIGRWQARFPRAAISHKPGDFEASFRLSGGGADNYWYLSGRVYEDGGFYIDRMSRLPETVAADMVAAMVATFS